MTNIATEQLDDVSQAVRSIPTVNVLPRALFKGPFRFLDEVIREHGDFVRLKAGPYSFYLCSNPYHFQYILRDNRKNFRKSEAIYKPGSYVTGNGLITSSGDFWFRQRRMMQPYFHRKRIEVFTKVITDSIDLALQTWLKPDQDRGNIKLMECMTQITVEVTTKVMFGANTMTAEEIATMSRDQAAIVRQIALFTYLLFLPEWIPRPGARKFDIAVNKMKTTIHNIIKLGHEDKDADTLLGMLIRAVDEDTNERMTDDQLFDEIQSIFIAGFETTSRGLTWMFYMLDKHPEILEKVLQEIEETVGDRTPELADLKNLKYCKMVVQEALRYYPPVVALPRTTLVDEEIDGVPIPAGKMVVMFYYGLHHNPKFWEDHDRFDPDRFTPENVEKRPVFAYLPFSVGPRQCIGNDFALMETILALVMILQRYRVKLVDNTTVEPHIATTLSPKKEIDAIVTRVK